MKSPRVDLSPAMVNNTIIDSYAVIYGTGDVALPDYNTGQFVPGDGKVDVFDAVSTINLVPTLYDP